MKLIFSTLNMKPRRSLAVAVLGVLLSLGAISNASADEADAKRLLKGMSDYLAAQNAFSFEYDATLEVVTGEGQKLALLSSGVVAVGRPNMLRATRHGGFVDVEMIFDGKTLTMFGKNANSYAEVDASGSIDQLVDDLRLKHNIPLPAADLLTTDVYTALMEDVTNVKDLGSGVINGQECDYLAFRAKEVDWQIWIAHGDRPLPIRYTLTSIKIDNEPQYTIETRNWRTADFTFRNQSGAKKVDMKDMKDARQLPDNFSMGEKK
jgi:hypothetical protein